MNSHPTATKNVDETTNSETYISLPKQSFDTYLAVCKFANVGSILKQTDIPSNDIIIVTGEKLNNLRGLLVKRFRQARKNTIFENEQLLKYCKVFKPGNSNTTLNVLIIAKPVAMLLLQDLKQWNSKRYLEIFTGKIQPESHEYKCLTNMLQTKGLFYNTCKRIIANTNEMACKHNINTANTISLGPEKETVVPPIANPMFTYNKRFDITALVKEIDKNLHIPDNITLSAIFLQSRTDSPTHLNMLCKRFKLSEFKNSNLTDKKQETDRKIKEKCTISKFRKLLDHSDVILLLIIDQAFDLSPIIKKSPLLEPPIAIAQFESDRDNLKKWLETTKTNEDKFSLYRALKALVTNANKFIEQLSKLSEELPSTLQRPLPSSSGVDTNFPVAHANQASASARTETSALSYSLFPTHKRVLEEEETDLKQEKINKKKKTETNIDRERYDNAITLLFFAHKAEETVIDSNRAINQNRHTV